MVNQYTNEFQYLLLLGISINYKLKIKKEGETTPRFATPFAKGE
jgi:hypothetical protein